MKRTFSGGACLAGVLTLSVAMAENPSPTQPPAQPLATQPRATQRPETPPAQRPLAAAQKRKAPQQDVTIEGCVQNEADYRRARNLGKGGAVGTGVGARDEFVLINASSSPIPMGRTEPAPTGTMGVAAGTEEFEVTGKDEKQLGSFIGKRVMITAKLKAAGTNSTGTTGGPTVAVPGSRDLKLREAEVISVREAAGTCPAMR
jgi:hypothetical protein